MVKNSLISVLSRLVLFLCISCEAKTDRTFDNATVDGRNVIVKKTYDKNGNLIVDEMLDKDSIKNGYYKEFTLGRLRDSGNFINGRKEGIWSYWDLNGDLIKTESWFSGKKFGEQIDYYSRIKADEGQALYKYSFYNPGGQNIFESKFNSDGTLMSTIGSPLYCIYNNNIITKGNTYELICFFGVPKTFQWSFKIVEFDKGKSTILFERKFSNDRANPYLIDLPFAKKILYQKKYLSKGVYNLKIFLEIKSKFAEVISKDSAQFTVSVL